jgi:hypothetical protein
MLKKYEKSVENSGILQKREDFPLYSMYFNEFVYFLLYILIKRIIYIIHPSEIPEKEKDRR